jgi:hypothetical protein
MAKKPSLKMKPDDARKAAEQCQELLKTDKQKIERRVGGAVIQMLARNAALLSDKTASTVALRAEKLGLTQDQNETAEQVADRVIAVRSALSETNASDVVRKMAGVGQSVNRKVVKSVLAAADMVIETYVNHTKAMAGAGVLPDDVDMIIGLANALQATDKTQEGAKKAAPLSTARRKALQLEVEEGLSRIIAAVGLEYVGSDPERVKMYRSLIPSRPTKKKKTQKNE